MKTRLDSLLKAQEHLGQAIERLRRAMEEIENIEPDLAADLKVTLRRACDVEHFVVELQDKEVVAR